MSKYLRNAALSVAAVAFGSTAANAVPPGTQVGLVGQTVTAHAAIVKPLTLSKVSDMDFGSITVLDTGVAHLNANGTLTCDTTLTCAANGTAAQYNVTGSNNQSVTITKPNVTLVNTADSSATLNLVLTGPSSLLITNAGAPGTNFSLGGDLNIPAATKEGTYQGDLNVTVNY